MVRIAEEAFNDFKVVGDYIELIFTSCSFYNIYTIHRSNITEIINKRHVRWLWLYLAALIILITKFGTIENMVAWSIVLYALYPAMCKNIIIRTNSGAEYILQNCSNPYNYDAIRNWFIQLPNQPPPPPEIQLTMLDPNAV